MVLGEEALRTDKVAVELPWEDLYLSSTVAI